MDLLPYWNLSERPFEATWDTRFYYRSREHHEALERLLFLVSEETMNMGLLTGEIGCGKTLLRAIFAEQLDRDRHELVVLENSSFPFKELLGSILRTLQQEQEDENSSKLRRYERFKEAAEEIHDEGRHLVLLLDEAQEMSSETLNELKLLTNLNGDGRNVLTLLLVGQPELQKRVGRLPAIDQRIMLRYHLRPFQTDETAAYLKHRLVAAKHPTGELFTDDSIQAIQDSSRGIPREINRIAKLSLEMAWLKELAVVVKPAVEAVVRDLERHQKLRAA